MHSDFDACYRAVASRDARFDGRFWTGVTSTGVYCRPSCPSRTPRRDRVRFFSHPAAAERAGFRACRRCRPQVSPGAPDYSVRADLVGRALRLIADGVVDCDGISGLARRLAVGQRHLHRELVAEIGVGPLAVARARRVALARQLLEQTRLPVAAIAMPAGFSSVRQLNASLRDAYGATPTQLRAATRPGRADGLALRLPYRGGLDIAALLGFLADRALPGVEEVVDGTYRRTVDVDGGGILELTPEPDGFVDLRVHTADPCLLAPLVARSRRLLDLDADPAAVAAVLGADPLLADLIRRRPGLRLPGSYDGFETAARTVLGQQVSVAAARTLASRLAAALGPPLDAADPGLSHRFPGPAAVAAAGVPALAALGMPAARAAAVHALATAVERGDVVLDGSGEPGAVRAALGALPGIGPWTVELIALRVLRDPDALPAGDLGLRRAFAAAGLAADPVSIRGHADAWRPWRAYGVLHLWTAGADRRHPFKEAS